MLTLQINMSIFGGVKQNPVVSSATYVYDQVAPTTGPAGFQDFMREQHLTLGDGDLQKAYVSRKKEKKTSIKWGQMKLLIAEVQFLTLYWNPEKVPSPKLVYVGAADGTHLLVLHKMFPDFEFHLYDPRQSRGADKTESAFDPILRDVDGITLYPKFFDDNDVAKWAGRNDVFFVCDIRTVTYCQEDNLSEAVQKVNEALVWDDMLRQQEWVQKIKPVKAHLKFRLPYSWDFVKAEGKSRPYLDGVVYLQQWGPQTTTETRLVPNDDLGTRQWDYEVHQDMMFYHNCITREHTKFINPLERTKVPIDGPIGLGNDYDSTATTVIVMEYLIKFGVDPSSDNVTCVLKNMIDGANNGATNLIGLRMGVKLAVLEDGDE